MEKPKPADDALKSFLAAVPDEGAQAECTDLAALMQKAEGSQPKLWAGKMLGYGDFHYRYATGREGDTFVVGFAYRKTGFSIYLGCGLQAAGQLLAKLGKHKIGVGCLYVRRLADIDRGVLKQLITLAVMQTRAAAAMMQVEAPRPAGSQRKPANKKPASETTPAKRRPAKK